MLKYSLQFSFLFSIQYLVFMLFCFGLLSFPAHTKEAFNLQLALIAIAGFVLVVTGFIGG